MQVNIQAVQLKAKQDLYDKIDTHLQQAFGEYKFITHADVFLKEIIDKGISKQEVEVRMHVNGDQLFAKNSEENFDTALRGVTGKLRKQLDKYKHKVYRSRM